MTQGERLAVMRAMRHGWLVAAVSKGSIRLELDWGSTTSTRRHMLFVFASGRVLARTASHC